LQKWFARRRAKESIVPPISANVQRELPRPHPQFNSHGQIPPTGPSQLPAVGALQNSGAPPTATGQYTPMYSESMSRAISALQEAREHAAQVKAKGALVLITSCERKTLISQDLATQFKRNGDIRDADQLTLLIWCFPHSSWGLFLALEKRRLLSNHQK
jgi:hypothetical protein